MNDSQAAKRVRPRRLEPHFYCSTEELAGIDRAARRMGLSRSSWIRYVARLAYKASDDNEAEEAAERAYLEGVGKPS